MTLSTQQLADRIGGGDCFIRTRNGEVSGMAIRLDLNPEAPSRILVGKGPRLEMLSRKFVEADKFVPVYIKLDTNKWDFLGRFKANYFETSSQLIDAHRGGRTGELSGVLFLVGEDQVTKHEDESSAGYMVDAERRKAIEKAAIDSVNRALIQQKDPYVVESVESQNLGFDLLAQRGSEVRRIEVKGTTSDTPEFFLSANEFQASRALPDWEIIVVTNAQDNPRLHRYLPEEMNERFDFKPVTYRCTLKGL